MSVQEDVRGGAFLEVCAVLYELRQRRELADVDISLHPTALFWLKHRRKRFSLTIHEEDNGQLPIFVLDGRDYHSAPARQLGRLLRNDWGATAYGSEGKQVHLELHQPDLRERLRHLILGVFGCARK